MNLLYQNAIAKHAALHNHGHDEAFLPLSPDGNPFSHTYWLAEENNETTLTTTRISLAPLQKSKDKPKAHMSKLLISLSLVGVWHMVLRTNVSPFP